MNIFEKILLASTCIIIIFILLLLILIEKFQKNQKLINSDNEKIFRILNDMEIEFKIKNNNPNLIISFENQDKKLYPKIQSIILSALNLNLKDIKNINQSQILIEILIKFL